MNENAKLGAAVVGGYILGRTKKGGTALRFAMFLGGNQNAQQLVGKGRTLASQVLASQEAKQITDQVRGPLQEAIQQAAMAAVQARMVGITKGLTARTQRLTDAANEVVESTAETVEDTTDTVTDTAEKATKPVSKLTSKLRGRGKSEPEPEPEEEESEQPPSDTDDVTQDEESEDDDEYDEDEEPEPEPEPHRSAGPGGRAMPDSFLGRLREDPATKDLLGAFGGFASAQVGNLATKAAGRVGGGDSASKSDQVKGGAMEGAGEAMAEGKNKIFGGIKGALKGLFKTGGSAKRPTNIYEQLFIGVPVEQAYQNWTEYSKFPEFMKGPESVKVTEEEGEDGETKVTQSWTAKIFLNRRSWKATVEEDVENSRIRWSTEAAKGTIDGAISFTPIGDNATLMVYTLEYRPKGFFEWWGNRWRTVGRRARLDVKHFGRYVMMQDQSQDEEQPDDVDGEDQAGVGEQDSPPELDEAGEPAAEGEPAGPDLDQDPEDEVDAREPEDTEDSEEPEDEPEPEQRRRVRGPDRGPRKPRQPRAPR